MGDLPMGALVPHDEAALCDRDDVACRARGSLLCSRAGRGPLGSQMTGSPSNPGRFTVESSTRLVWRLRIVVASTISRARSKSNLGVLERLVRLRQ
jgi:hypothetical protein